MGEKKTKPEKKRRQRVRIHEVTAENDTRYLGPLSFQHLQALGWLCIVLAQAVGLLHIAERLDKSFAAEASELITVLGAISQFSVPLLLLASFARILNDSDGYKRQFLRNGVAAASICGLYYLLVYRYMAGTVGAITGAPEAAPGLVQEIIGSVARGNVLEFNLFIDLLLCTLVMFFMNYRPVRFFRGRWVILLRLATLLPIGYEVYCMSLKVQAARGLITLPLWSLPLFPVKPPMTFLLFIILALYVKTRERRFRRRGKTHADYRAFLTTRRNSLNFSVFLAVMMVVISLLDGAVVMGFSVVDGVEAINGRLKDAEVLMARGASEAGADGADTAAGLDAIMAAEAAMDEMFTSGEMDETLMRGAEVAREVGFGQSTSLALLAPLMLLFSYTRKPKYPMVSVLIPVAGIALILLTDLEGLYQIIRVSPLAGGAVSLLEEEAGAFLTLLE